MGSLTKDTEAYIATATVNADGNVVVQAASNESMTSISASIGVGGSVGIAGSAGIYVVEVTTRAFIGNDPTNPTLGATSVTASGSVLVGASEATTLDLLSGNVSGAGAASVGAAAIVPVITKTTESFIGAGASVTALGKGGAINADNGQFAISTAPFGSTPAATQPPTQKADVTNTNNSNQNDISTSRLTSQRIATPETQPVHGLAVTAVNGDSLEGVGIDGGASGAVAINLSGVVTVLTNHTHAYIGAGAQVNASNTGAASNQSVLVASGNDTSFLGIAGALSISGTLSVTPGVTVLVVSNETPHTSPTAPW